MAEKTGRKAVAIGGGTGLPAVLTTLVELGFETSAVVTMADDGGSSGALRRELGMLPPGDVRNCLVALADDPEGIRAQLFQYRFPSGEGLAGHALGNLIIAALADMAGDFPEAIGIAADLLGAKGRVLPSTLTDVVLHGIDRAGNEVIGQACLAENPEPVEAAFLEPEDPEPYASAIESIAEADAIVIGPGSLYTSLVPNFLVDGVASAVLNSDAIRLYVCNVANMRGETHGLDAADHVQALADHRLDGAIDVALVHDGEGAGLQELGADTVGFSDDVVRRIEALGVRVIAADFADPRDPVRHSREALRRVLGEVLA